MATERIDPVTLGDEATDAEAVVERKKKKSILMRSHNMQHRVLHGTGQSMHDETIPNHMG